MTLVASIRTVPPPGLAFRRISDQDLPFLAEVYASTRRDEIAPLPWSEEQKAQFLQWQFQCQHVYYQQYYPHCEFLIIERHETAAGETQPVGRLYVDRWAGEIRLVDIALLPPFRGRGLGSALLGSILDEARAAAVPVTIHVEANNPALSLYRRFGFRHVSSNGIYYLMQWQPP